MDGYGKIEYIKETHQYLINAKLVPSVTKIVDWKFDIYKDVPKSVLTKKAKYGSRVHDLCERLMDKKITLQDLDKEDEEVKQAVYDFQYLMKEHCFYPKSMEQKINYKNKYCGTYDILTEDNLLIDLKTTASLHIDNETLQAPLNLQMSLYAMALKGVEEAWYIWLPKKVRPNAIK